MDVRFDCGHCVWALLMIRFLLQALMLAALQHNSVGQHKWMCDWLLIVMTTTTMMSAKYVCVCFYVCVRLCVRVCVWRTSDECDIYVPGHVAVPKSKCAIFGLTPALSAKWMFIADAEDVKYNM